MLPDAVELVQLKQKFLAISKRSGVSCNVRTNSYIWSIGVALSNTCSELYCVQFEQLTSACSTPLFYRLTVESILTGSSAAHRTVTFITHIDNIAC